MGLSQEGQIKRNLFIAPGFVSPVKNAWLENRHSRNALIFHCILGLEAFQIG